jgi:muramoyltetrapeptide carboxypeptidase LdcA involved in peptidoglycan recycling
MPTAAAFPRRLEHALGQLATTLDVSIEVGPNVRCSEAGFCAGPVKERAAILNEFIANPKLDAIFCTIGGFNSAEILPYLDVNMAITRPKILVGYSDCSALLLGVQSLTGLVTFHGPTIMTQFGEYPSPFEFTVRSLDAAVRSDLTGTLFEDPPFWTNERLEWGNEEWLARPRVTNTPATRSIWATGNGVGTIWGGNLETINLLAGTPYMKIPDSIVLFWEVTEAEAYLPRVRRALTHLEQCGILERTTAMLVGRSPEASPVMNQTFRDVVLDITSNYPFPVVADLPIGHTDPLATLPIGIQVSVEVEEKATIRFLESAISAG